MAKKLNIITIILVIALAVLMSGMGVWFAIVKTKENDKTMVTVTIVQDNETPTRYVIDQANTTSKQIKKGEDLTLSYSISSNYVMTGTPVFVCTANADHTKQFSCVVSVADNKVTVKAVDQDATLSLSNPPASKITISVYDGQNVIASIPTVNANGKLDIGVFETNICQSDNYKEKFLIGLYTDAAMTQPFDWMNGTLSATSRLYTKWETYFPYIYFENISGMSIEIFSFDTDQALTAEDMASKSPYFNKVLHWTDGGTTIEDYTDPQIISVSISSSIASIKKLYSSDATDYQSQVITKTETESSVTKYTLNLTKIKELGTLYIDFNN